MCRQGEDLDAKRPNVLEMMRQFRTNMDNSDDDDDDNSRRHHRTNTDHLTDQNVPDIKTPSSSDLAASADTKAPKSSPVRVPTSYL